MKSIKFRRSPIAIIGNWWIRLWATAVTLELEADVPPTILHGCDAVPCNPGSVGADIYFVASRWDSQEKIDGTFRVAGKQPELWDPMTGEIRDAPAFHPASGRTTVPLEFSPRESVFVVFRRPTGATTQGTTASNYPKISTLSELDGAWNVAFDPKWGGPERGTRQRAG